MVIKCRIQAAKKFGHDTWNLDTGFDSHVAPAFIDWMARRREENPSDKMRGPHEGRYLTLMLKGLKPLAWVSRDELKHFQPYIKSGQLVDGGPLYYHDPNDRKLITDHMVVLPGEEWRARALQKTLIRYEDEDGPSDAYDIKLGKLLGMSNTEIRYYLGR